MADWPLRGDGQRIEAAGEDTSDSSGTEVTTGNANAKGSYTELIASTAFDATAFIWYTAGKTASESYLLDLALGAAGSEQIIVADFALKCRRNVPAHPTVSLFELPVPEGSRIAVQGQSTTASDPLDTQVLLIGYSFLPSSPFGRAETYGADGAASKGTAIDPGATANTTLINDGITATDFIELEKTEQQLIDDGYLPVPETF